MGRRNQNSRAKEGMANYIPSFFFFFYGQREKKGNITSLTDTREERRPVVFSVDICYHPPTSGLHTFWSSTQGIEECGMKEKRMNADKFFCFVLFFVFLASRLLPFVNVSRKTRIEGRKRRKEDETIETCGAKVCVLLKGKTPLFYSIIFCCFFVFSSPWEKPQR